MKRTILYNKNEFMTFYVRNKSDTTKRSKNIIGKEKKNNIISIIPIVSYNNADKDKHKVYMENKRKSGIYRINNLITGKSYIGSSVNIAGRFSNYYSLVYLENRVKKGSSIIYSSLLKHGYSNFSIDILEYCEPLSLLEKEQYYIDLLKPEYNILKIAGSRFGSKQSEETKKLISNILKNRVFTKESKVKMKIAANLRTGIKTSFFGKIHTLETKNKIALTKYLSVKVTNIKTNTEVLFVNNLEAAQFLKVGESTLRRYKKEGKILLKKYLITNA